MNKAILAILILSAAILSGCLGEQSQKQGIANPASENCLAKGGRLEIRTDASGNQLGYCIFPNGKECEEWAFYRGECSLQ